MLKPRVALAVSRWNITRRVAGNPERTEQQDCECRTSPAGWRFRLVERHGGRNGSAALEPATAPEKQQTGGGHDDVEALAGRKAEEVCRGFPQKVDRHPEAR